MKIGFIGSGLICEIITQNILNSGLVKAEDIHITDIFKARENEMHERYGLTVAASKIDVIKAADIVFVCVRSDNAMDLAEELREIQPDFSNKVLISISSGIPMKLYGDIFPDLAIARALPNPPSRIGHGVVAVAFNKNVSDEQKAMLMQLFDSMGKAYMLDEEKINVATATTGPAPVYAFFQAMVESALLLGIDYKSASHMAFGTVEGCLKVWERQIDDIAGLLRETSTPGGISVRQLYALEKRAFKAIVKENYEEGWSRTKAYSDAIRESLKK
ncbi:MAG: pyrroline-5-carboxylate reductase dimerization domain-containing protein [Aminobacterium sp.]|jgi:pyrroline-5-carboxylate reductase|nr:pyrroline-5-carboxylate reductase dimerization domain-containing protein [Aminobacterium sp.]MDD3425556.1 pyrroline-5-carboxylate reductase dimerization domain-containing protein [Aminobacterium sp.]MDD3708664.1 pyrroline-5-carboxylate reductase dimerization domain-containing protein [Aminobacterium sp.]MDD4552386.1 pyrroline-5-carboxylate reductase dimerization domain-containing protein [Aminobacterium sp.]MEA4877954.1 pyrroline-5-carboxylate reductase dimerization domain-containing protein